LAGFPAGFSQISEADEFSFDEVWFDAAEGVMVPLAGDVE
jgi:hypothetical protein